MKKLKMFYKELKKIGFNFPVFRLTINDEVVFDRTVEYFTVTFKKG